MIKLGFLPSMKIPYMISIIGVFLVGTIFYLNIQSDNQTYYYVSVNKLSPVINMSLLAENDYDKIMNINFRFTTLNLVCSNDSNHLLLILVHSATTNFLKREIIRETWGKNDKHVKILFLLGSSTSEDYSSIIYAENVQYKDIIQGNFLDVYTNLTYKHMMAFKYFLYHCPGAKYILKVDDDIVINIPLLKEFLTKDIFHQGVAKLLMCNTVSRARTYRSFKSKWRLSFKEYPNRYFPTYCYGWFILYSPDVIFNLYRQTQMSEYFWIDDVYITGIMVEKIGNIKHHDIEHLTLWKWPFLQRHIIHYRKYFLVAGPDLEEHEMRFLWAYANESVRETDVAYSKKGIST